MGGPVLWVNQVSVNVQSQMDDCSKDGMKSAFLHMKSSFGLRNALLVTSHKLFFSIYDKFVTEIRKSVYSDNWLL